MAAFHESKNDVKKIQFQRGILGLKVIAYKLEIHIGIMGATKQVITRRYTGNGKDIPTQTNNRRKRAHPSNTPRSTYRI
jgi:hypothetical protein